MKEKALLMLKKLSKYNLYLLACLILVSLWVLSLVYHIPSFKPWRWSSDEWAAFDFMAKPYITYVLVYMVFWLMMLKRIYVAFYVIALFFIYNMASIPIDSFFGSNNGEGFAINILNTLGLLELLLSVMGSVIMTIHLVFKSKA
jgi:hypothetical protein